MPFKGRIDVLGTDFICDLKTCQSCSPEKFKYDFRDYGYGLKLAGYRALYKKEFGSLPEVYIVAAETSDDFDVCVYPVPSHVLDNYWIRLKSLLLGYKECRETGRWPGVDDGDESVILPIVEYGMNEVPETPLDWTGVEDVETETSDSEPVAEMPF